MLAEPLSSDQRRAFPQTARRGAQAPPELDRFLSLQEVMRLTTLAKATIYRRISHGTFPRSITLSRTKVAWSARDIAQWQETLRRNSETVADPTANSDALSGAGELIAA